jgi:hypothetical protein
MPDLKQLTVEEINALARRALAADDIDVASLCNEVLFQRSRSKGGTLEVTTLVSARTGEGIVHFEMGETRVQMTVAEARGHALAIIEAAMCAETDALLMKFLRDKVGLKTEAWQAAMSDFRRMRDPATKGPVRE